MNATVADRRYKNLRGLVLFTTILIFVQLIIAAAMRHQHAGLAISDFPLAHGSLWPDTSAEAVARYNAQRVSINGENPITAFQIELQMAHRIVALVILICVGIAVFCSRRCQSAERAIAPPTHVGGYESMVAVRLSLFWLGIDSFSGRAGRGNDLDEQGRRRGDGARAGRGAGAGGGRVVVRDCLSGICSGGL